MNETIELKEQTEKATGRLDTVAGGLFMVVMGIVFLAHNTVFDALGAHAWLLFLAIPIYWILFAAYRAYLEAGRRFTTEVGNRLLWGLFPFAIIGWGALGLDYALIWPVTIIIIGAGMVLRRA